MKPEDWKELQIPYAAHKLALSLWKQAFQNGTYTSKEQAIAALQPVVHAPALFTNDSLYGELARFLISIEDQVAEEKRLYGSNPSPAAGEFGQWGDEIDEAAIKQMRDAVNLPVAIGGALMPDAHLGYGLPIGGVLATHEAVIPYAVGVDIACRMKLSVLDAPIECLEDAYAPRADTFIRALTGATFFGTGTVRRPQAEHPVMDMDWNVSPVTRRMKDRAAGQLGTSGSGNHFVEFGVLTLNEPELGLEAGQYVAVLSHSGSRGTGASVCQHYVDIAQSKLPEVYKSMANLAWLPMASEAGQEYWQAMNLMGEYAKANHAVIHEGVARSLRCEILATVENHHNFAWKETHNGQEVYVHRKGATPAGAGVLGVIPGSMADPAFVVRGKGNLRSLESASHGAGRKMSRTQALKTFRWEQWKSKLKQQGVRLLSAGLDEVPGVYKDIRQVMAAQKDLVDVVAQFDPKVVKMSDDGRAED